MHSSDSRTNLILSIYVGCNTAASEEGHLNQSPD